MNQWLNKVWPNVEWRNKLVAKCRGGQKKWWVNLQVAKCKGGEMAVAKCRVAKFQWGIVGNPSGS